MFLIEKLLSFSPAIIGMYLCTSLCLMRALWHVFARRCLTAKLALGKEALLDALCSCTEEADEALRGVAHSHEHPAISTACRLLDVSSVTSDIFQRWFDRDIELTIDPVKEPCRANREQAAVLGFIGTVLGLILGMGVLLSTNDNLDLIAAVRMSLGTTLLGAVASQLIEGWNYRALKQLQKDLRFESAELLDFFTKPRGNPNPLPAEQPSHPRQPEETIELYQNAESFCYELERVE